MSETPFLVAIKVTEDDGEINNDVFGFKTEKDRSEYIEEIEKQIKNGMKIEYATSENF